MNFTQLIKVSVLTTVVAAAHSTTRQIKQPNLLTLIQNKDLPVETATVNTDLNLKAPGKSQEQKSSSTRTSSTNNASSDEKEVSKLNRRRVPRIYQAQPETATDYSTDDGETKPEKKKMMQFEESKSVQEQMCDQFCQHLKGAEQYVDERCPKSCMNLHGFKKRPAGEGSVKNEAKTMMNRFHFGSIGNELKKSVN